MFGNVTTLVSWHYQGNTGTKACSAHAPGMRPGILAGNAPVRSPACGWTQSNGAAVEADSGSHGDGGGRDGSRHAACFLCSPFYVKGVSLGYVGRIKT